jgi:hypothetical protein
MMPIMRIHVHHLSNIPYFQTSIIARSVKLIIFLVELYACDSVSVTQESLDLPLVVDVPDSDNAIFATADKVFTVG